MPNEEEDGAMNKLEIVDFRGMNLETFPINPTINLSNICKLDISNNNLQSIPESLTARLLNIVVLDVHSNQIKFLPNSIGCLCACVRFMCLLCIICFIFHC
ncbi:leucine-rich repeat-containing protein [Dorcoceras hygrometricum]|uniref:Leucine-rich repeat-containing protein n=1 Tax=Dorcoceras hygrometricum TaxID=472368 RepID=A0A2Z7AMR2_9LAMI|nr:leucine-rich repeat-containing protein [Dorcoceras hygrometricum]